MSSKIILCQVKRADEPYYMEDINRYLYSIEELCWFIDHNLALVDDGFFDTTLTDWIRHALQLPELADRMDHILSGGEGEEEPADEAALLAGIDDSDDTGSGTDKGDMLERLIYVVNAEISWIYVPDRQAFRREISGLRHLSAGERMKRRADTLISYGKYTRALQVYKRIIRDAEKEESDASAEKVTADVSAEKREADETEEKSRTTGDRTAILCGTVWHNMGVAYARLFQFDEACVCMRRAYNLLHSNEILRDYLCCVLISRGREAFEDLADRLGADTVTRAEIRSSVENVREKKAPANIDEALNTWVRDYHRQTAP